MKQIPFKKLISLVTLTLTGWLIPVVAFAQEHTGGSGEGKNQIIALSAAIAISIAAAGGAVGQGRAAATAFESMARNPSIQPKIFTSMILGLAFIESLVIYAMLISFLLMAKI